MLVKMPCNLAVLDMNAADSIPERFSEVTDPEVKGNLSLEDAFLELEE